LDKVRIGNVPAILNDLFPEALLGNYAIRAE
jgi:hypothetical protein